LLADEDLRRLYLEVQESRAQLRALSRRLLSVAEDERARIAREIHDELGQMLSALTLDLGWLASKLSTEAPAFSEKVAGMIALVDVITERVQAIAANLRPAILDDLGLAPALEWLVQKFQQRGGIECDLELPDADLNLDSDRATTVFRLVQEALTNVARHAGATHVAISLAKDTDRLVLDVQDNGRGIRPQEITASTSLGLVGMRERVNRWGGRFEIAGSEGQGTRLHVEVPLAVTKAYSRTP
jgi:two-component system sensor histidine kinase UhpB